MQRAPLLIGEHRKENIFSRRHRTDGAARWDVELCFFFIFWSFIFSKAFLSSFSRSVFPLCLLSLSRKSPRCVPRRKGDALFRALWKTFPYKIYVPWARTYLHITSPVIPSRIIKILNAWKTWSFGAHSLWFSCGYSRQLFWFLAKPRDKYSNSNFYIHWLFCWKLLKFSYYTIYSLLLF